MKKMILIAIIASLLMTSCLGTMFFMVKITDDITVACETEFTTKTGELGCAFDIAYMGSIFGCEVALKDLKKGWKPMEDGKLAYGCKLIAEIPKDTTE